MLATTTRFKRHFAPYRTPQFKLGAIIEDQIRGKVAIVGLMDALVPWPIGTKGRNWTRANDP